MFVYMFRFGIKLGALGLILSVLVYVGASFEPAVRARATMQFQQNWMVGQAVTIENLKKWEFKDITFNEQYINALQRPNQVIVIGSSHLMFVRAVQLDSPSAPIKSDIAFFNHWITGINNGLDIPQHFYNQYQQRDLPPKLVILGIDPWLLQGGASDPLPNAIGANPFTTPAAKPPNTPLDLTIWQTFKQAFEGDTKQVLNQRQRDLSNKLKKFQYIFTAPFPAWATISQPMAVSHVMNRDGSFTCAPDVIRCQWESIEAQRQKVREGLPKNIDIFSQPINPTLQQQFEVFIQHMHHNGSKVIFVMTPLHEITYATVKAMPNLQRIDTYYRRVANQYNIPLVGSFDPTACGLLEHHFVDADHLNEIGTAKLLAQPNCTTGPWAEVIATIQR